MNDAVVKQLHAVYNDKIETLENYLANGLALQGIRGQAIAEQLLDDVDTELAHARRVGQRLRVLGEQPYCSFGLDRHQECLQPLDSMQGDEAVLAIIDGVIEADEATLSTLEELATVAADANDPVTEQIAVDLLAETQQHLRVFRDARTEYAPPPH